MVGLRLIGHRRFLRDQHRFMARERVGKLDFFCRHSYHALFNSMPGLGHLDGMEAVSNWRAQESEHQEKLANYRNGRMALLHRAKHSIAGIDFLLSRSDYGGQIVYGPLLWAA